MEKYAQTHAGDYEKPHLTTPPTQVAKKEEETEKPKETETKPEVTEEEPKKIKDDPCP